MVMSFQNRLLNVLMVHYFMAKYGKFLSLSEEQALIILKK